MRMQGVNPWSREMFQSIRYANNTKVNSVKTKEDEDCSRSTPFITKFLHFTPDYRKLHVTLKSYMFSIINPYNDNYP